jgi:hypothetical protein
MNDARTIEASRLMLAFAGASGLTGEGAPRRYLWTDAHAVCNFLTLAATTGDSRFGQLAVALADQVHNVLGRHRLDDDRSGWISGLDESAGREHPTAGGLRIGKPLPERRCDAAYDEHAEWEQDGQYYHYLTKWMHALLQLGKVTGENRYRSWAKELALTAGSRFRAPSGPPRLYWKMSIDLSYPLVPSSGQHDPLDGLVTALTIKAADLDSGDHELDELITELTDLCREGYWETDDPLGIGGLLFDAGRLAQLAGSETTVDRNVMMKRLIEASMMGLAAFLRSSTLQLPGSSRLAFRELGLSTGLHAVALIQQSGFSGEYSMLLDRLITHARLSDVIEHFWLDPAQQRTSTWAAHQDINAVMLATSLAPAGFLNL